MLVKKELWVRPGVVSIPGGIPVAIWGLADGPTAEPQLPGPVIEAAMGDILEITLHNTLNEPVSLTFPGQKLIPDPVLTPKGLMLSLARYAFPGENVVYTFPATRPGTFRYEAGTRPERQLQMGLYGALIIRPPGQDHPDRKDCRTAYGEGTGSDYDVEAVILLSELDPTANNSIAGNAVYHPTSYTPRFCLVNGRPFPDSLGPPDTSTQPFTAYIPSLVGQRILLRAINIGFLSRTLAIKEGAMRVIAEDGWPRRTVSDSGYNEKAVILVAGRTCDLIFTLQEGKHYLYDREPSRQFDTDKQAYGIVTLIDVRESFPAGVPPAPNNLTAKAVQPGRVDLAWASCAISEEGFVVERRVGVEGPFLRVTTLTGGTPTYQDRCVQGDTSYTYRVVAYNAAGASGCSNEATVTPATLVLPKNSPSLTAKTISSSQINASYDGSVKKERYSVKQRNESPPDFVKIGVVPTNTTIGRDSLLVQPETEDPPVRGYRTRGVLKYAMKAAATINTIPVSPSNLSAKAIYGNGIKVAWTDNSVNAEGFIIERSVLYDASFKEVARLGPTVTEFLDTRVFRWTRHFYRVKAYNSYGVSTPSNINGTIPSGPYRKKYPIPPYSNYLKQRRPSVATYQILVP